MKKIYAGIGSRAAPNFVLTLVEFFIARKLVDYGFTLRSGGAKGMDQAFEYGCDLSSGKKEIWLPWKGFENNKSPLVVESEEAFRIAEKFHPAWYNLTDGVKKLHARNVHQILGGDLNTPCDFIICWTKDGKGQGGTGQALRIANEYKIPILDLGIFSTMEEMVKAFEVFLSNFDVQETFKGGLHSQ